jgi:hypothetical protein
VQDKEGGIGKCKILNPSVKIMLWPQRKGNIEREGLSKVWEIFREGGRGRYSAESCAAEYSERIVEGRQVKEGTGVN